MDGGSCFSTRAHGADHGSRAGGDIAAGPDSLFGGLARVEVDDDVPFLAYGQPRRCSRNQWVGTIANGMDHTVEWQDELGPWNRHRAAPAGGVWFPQFHFLTLQSRDTEMIVTDGF